MPINRNIPISIFIIAKNEADRLPKTLAAIHDLSRDIILIDSGSTDETVKIAKSFGAKIIVNEPFPGYGEQKRFGEDQCLFDWVLNIDADEVISPKLKAEISARFAIGYPDCDGFRVRIVDLMPSETKPGLWPYSVNPVRLYRRSRGRYNPSIVHDRVDMAKDAQILQLRHPILHFPVRSLGEQMQKLLRYSDLQSENLLKKGRKIRRWRIYAEFPLAFLKAYILRRYALKGTYGFLLAINYAYYRMMRIGKAYERDLLSMAKR